MVFLYIAWCAFNQFAKLMVTITKEVMTSLLMTRANIVLASLQVLLVKLSNANTNQNVGLYRDRDSAVPNTFVVSTHKRTGMT